MRLERGAGVPRADLEAALKEVLGLARQNECGGLHEGFWADHWHYVFDLLELYLVVYPDRLREVLLGERAYRFFDDPDVVLPRSKRIVRTNDGRVRSYGAVVRDEQKLAIIAARDEDPYSARAEGGAGEVYKTTLLVKLLSVAVNRTATLDPSGVGVEMEAGKPGWNDSMNGLPGLFGSGLSETMELRRALRFLHGACKQLGLDGEGLPGVFVELKDLMSGLRPIIRRRLEQPGEPAAARRYWDDSNTQKELYRERTRLGVSGEEAHVDGEELTDFMFEARALLDLVCAGPLRRAAMSPSGVPYTYFIHEATSAEPTPEESHLGLPLVRPTSFEGRPTKLFLEGAVHWMKDRPGDAAAVHEAVCRSPLYDRKLKMFKSCESMEGESYELGRAVGAYPPGWIENESVYLHMEYKYLLELIRSGEPEAFWEAARTALVPFCDPAVYGRSTLEGASFLVSSAYEDPREHGRAYQPRLSGITCEMLHMWVIAVAGPRPFDLDTDGRLRLALDPALPGWLFTEAPRRASYHDAGNGWKDLEIPAGALAFKLLNRALVVYHNPERRETYGGSGVRPVSYRLLYRSGEQVEIRAPSVGAPHAEAVRDGAVARIDVELS